MMERGRQQSDRTLADGYCRWTLPPRCGPQKPHWEVGAKRRAWLPEHREEREEVDEHVFG